MSRKKLHIDKLFKEGLKDFSLFVSDRDFNAIDDKASVFKEQTELPADNASAFSDFELEISDNDWLATKAKLDNEKQLIQSDNAVSETFKDFTLEPDPQDWPITYDKYKKAKRRRVAFWWLSTGIVILLLSTVALLMNNPKAERVTAKESSAETTITNQDTNYNTTDNTISDETTKTQTQKTEEQTTGIPQQNPINPDITKNAKGKVQSGRVVGNPVLSRDPITKTESNPINITEPAKVPVANSDNSEPDTKTSPDIDSKSAQQQKDNFTLGTATKVSPIQPIAGQSPEQNADLPDSAKKGKKDKKEEEDDKKIIKPLKNPQYYLAMVNQVDYTYRLLAGTNNATYNTIRNNADKGMLQYTGGIEFGVMAGKNQFSSGLNYTAQTWESDYNYTYKLFDSIPYYDTGRVLKGYFLFPKKDTTMNESRSVTLTNIQLPISYNRLWDLNARLRLSAGLSTILSYTVKAEGDKIISHENRQLYYYSRLKNQEQSFNIAPAVNFGLQYQLSSQWMLAGNLGGNISLRSRFKPAFGARDYPYSAGLNLKLIYLLK